MTGRMILLLALVSTLTLSGCRFTMNDRANSYYDEYDYDEEKIIIHNEGPRRGHRNEKVVILEGKQRRGRGEEKVIIFDDGH